MSTAMTINGKSFIGSNSASEGDLTFRAVNPATGETLDPPFSSATTTDADKAAQLAAEAFTHYGRLSGIEKAAFLRTIAVGMEDSAEQITQRANLETGLPLPRLQSELARTCNQLSLFASLLEDGSWVDARIDHADRDRKPVPKPDIRSMLRPLGPVAVFGSSNFPLAFSTAGGDTASAFAAGCPVIVKAHPAHPGTSALAGLVIRQSIQQHGLPEGVFALLFDDGYDVGTALVKHPQVKAVGFTGSRRGGLALVDVAAARPEPIPVYAEMGSVNPVFVLPDALHARPREIAAGLHNSVTLGVGQFCTNPGLVFVQEGDGAREFLDELERLMRATPPGTMLTSGIASTYRKGVEVFANTPGVETRIEAASKQDPLRCSAALFSTDATTFLSTGGLMDEVFGPSTLVVMCIDRSAMLMVANALEGQLTTTLHATSQDVASHQELLTILERKAGRLVLNGYPTGVEVCNAMVHGGPFPATSDGRSTSVGTRAIQRFTRPVCYQDFDDTMLPAELQNDNPCGIWRLVNGRMMINE